MSPAENEPSAEAGADANPALDAEKSKAAVCAARQTVERFRILSVYTKTGAGYAEDNGVVLFFPSPDGKILQSSKEEVDKAKSFTDYRVCPISFTCEEDVRQFLYLCTQNLQPDPNWTWKAKKSLIRFSPLDELQGSIVEAKQHIEAQEFRSALRILEAMQYADEADESIWQQCHELATTILGSPATDEASKQKATTVIALVRDNRRLATLIKSLEQLSQQSIDGMDDDALIGAHWEAVEASVLWDCLDKFVKELIVEKECLLDKAAKSRGLIPS